MNALVTGSAGFIGFHLTKALLSEGINVIGVDNLNDYYDVNLKKARLKNIEQFIRDEGCTSNYEFIKLDISDANAVSDLFVHGKFDVVFNLAAQAGVRYSIVNPYAYISSNIAGFVNVLEGCRAQEVKHLVYASSSSVYGMNSTTPFSVKDAVDHPVSLYAATKKSNELIAHSYSHLYRIPVTGLRFFTVYGPWGRPDMAYYSFTEKILNGETIDIYNNGKMQRDFTFIDDIVEAILKIKNKPPIEVEMAGTHLKTPYQIYNIGNNRPVGLELFVNAIENALGIKACKNYLPMQQGDVPITYANISPLKEKFGFIPKTKIDDGIQQFVDWYLDYRKN